VDVGFSHVATEREKALHRKKEQLLVSARRRYLDKHKPPQSSQDITQ